MLSPLACLPPDYGVFRIGFTFLKTQHFANYVELHIIGGASTVKSAGGGPLRSEDNLDGAQRAVQWKGLPRKVND
jgi:hypothetical protein